jgi:DNA-binding response OmpR family regulator
MPMRSLCGFLKRMIAGPNSLRNKFPAETAYRPGILALTADLGFYSSVLSAACSHGWSAEWASSMDRALEICRSRVIRILIYDRSLPSVDWHYGMDRLGAAASQARILLAAPRIDEDLWREVLRRRGYDVLARSAGSEQLKRELRFAWLSLQEFRLHEQKVSAAPGSVGCPAASTTERRQH